MTHKRNPWPFPTAAHHPAATPPPRDTQPGDVASGSPERELAQEQQESDRAKTLASDRAKGLRKP